MSATALKRSISLFQATSINMIDMIGIGPFIVIPIVMGAMGGRLYLFPWLLGAGIAILDGMIWAELGAAYPLAGGSYQFLKASYQPFRWGGLMPFLFVWQTLVQAPLVAASAAIGFAQYFSYLLPLSFIGQKIISGSVVILITFLLYRRIDSIGRISVLLWSGVIVTIAWIIFGGLTHIQQPIIQSSHQLLLSPLFSEGLAAVIGHATVQTIYSFLGYYNVCHLGGEIRRPEKNIPKSIFISIVGVTGLYLLMNISIAAVLPIHSGNTSSFIVSIFIEKIYGTYAARVATALVLWIAFASLFSLMLGYSRIPYAAAADGNFFPVFGRLHRTKQFPHVSLLAMSVLAFIFSLLFKIQWVISAILAMRILVQFISQAIGLVLLHRRGIRKKFPFKMWLFPLPLLFSIAAWLYIFWSTGWLFALSGLIMMATGIIIYFSTGSLREDWKEKVAALAAEN
jgi:fructoselysine transporter